MQIYKSIADISKLSPSDPSYAVILDLLHQFSSVPEIQGYIVLVESGDTHVNLPELKSCIAGMGWDGVVKQAGHYHAVYLTNNEFALEFIIPDADWLDADLRAGLEDQAQKGPPYMKTIPF